MGQFTDERDVVICKTCPKGYYTNDQPSSDDVVRKIRCQGCREDKSKFKTGEIDQIEKIFRTLGKPGKPHNNEWKGWTELKYAKAYAGKYSKRRERASRIWQERPEVIIHAIIPLVKNGL